MSVFSKKRRQRSLAFNYIVLGLLTVFALLPILVLVFNSLKSRVEIGLNPLGPPREIHLENFSNAWVVGEFGKTMTNSTILVIGTVSVLLLLGGMAAYSLARLQPFGSDSFMLFMLVGSTLPIWLFLVPLFYMWRQLGLVDSLFGLTIIYVAINAPITIFLLRSYFVQIPKDFEDAARIDGANDLQIFFRIILPLTWPGFLTVGLVVGLAVWSEFQIALIFVHDADLRPLTTSYYNFTEKFSRDWALTSAGAVMMIFPVIVLFLLLQRRFIDGLTQGGLKG